MYVILEKWKKKLEKEEILIVENKETYNKKTEKIS